MKWQLSHDVVKRHQCSFRLQLKKKCFFSPGLQISSECWLVLTNEAMKSDEYKLGCKYSFLLSQIIVLAGLTGNVFHFMKLSPSGSSPLLLLLPKAFTQSWNNSTHLACWLYVARQEKAVHSHVHGWNSSDCQRLITAGGGTASNSYYLKNCRKPHHHSPD